LGRQPGVLEHRPEVVNEQDLRGDGRSFGDFFTEVTSDPNSEHAPFTGYKATPGEEVAKSYEPLIKPTPSVEAFANNRSRYMGLFDNHISTSIPGYSEVQNIVGNAIAKTYGYTGRSVLDLGASEGAFGKAITSMTHGKVRTVSLDPNAAMRDTFNSKPQVHGATFDYSAFSFLITDLFNKVNNLVSGLCDVGVFGHVGLFVFQGLHKALGIGIVLGNAFAAHADGDAVVNKCFRTRSRSFTFVSTKGS
jgi:hypothetical protein